jgi:hypothetical protein
MAYKSTINTGLPNIADPPDPLFFAEITRIYNAIRNLTVAIDSYTGAISADPSYYSQLGASGVKLQNLTRIYVPFSEPVSHGQMVNLYNSGGQLTARLASGSVSYPVRGWCSDLNGGFIGEYGEVMLEGANATFYGLTPGILYYLSNTAGAISVTPGTLSQRVGFALSSTILFVRPDL